MAIVTKTNIISAIAYWAIRQSPYDVPQKLEAAIEALSKRIDEKGIFESTEKKSMQSYKEIDGQEIFKLVTDLCHNTPEVAVWNITQYELDKGFTDPNDVNRPVKFGTSSRYDHPKAHYDFIDLDALARNATNMILIPE